MDHHDHVNLIREGLPGGDGLWADLGAGSGAFTLALADLLGEGAIIYAVDRDGDALRSNELSLRRRFPAATVHYLVADIAGALVLPVLDGIVMANVLHFQRDQLSVLRRARSYLRPGGTLVTVEYDARRASFAVPHPLPPARLTELVRQAGFVDSRLMVRRPSRWLGDIYSATCRSPSARPARL